MSSLATICLTPTVARYLFQSFSEGQSNPQDLLMRENQASASFSKKKSRKISLPRRTMSKDFFYCQSTVTQTNVEFGILHTSLHAASVPI
jgi:hypothetical protein